MVTKSDKTVAQPADECNDTSSERISEGAKLLSESLTTVIRAEIAKHPDLSPEDLFLDLSDFVIAMALATQDALGVMEDAMVDRDPTYPKGILTPTFLMTFMDNTKGNCRLVRIPSETLQELGQSILESGKPAKEMLN